MSDMVEVTVKLPAELVSRWRARGITDAAAHLQALAQEVDEDKPPQAQLRSEWTPPTQQEIEETIAALSAAAAAFREGLSEAELAQIVHDMNVEYVDPDDLHLFDWVQALPEDER